MSKTRWLAAGGVLVIFAVVAGGFLIPRNDPPLSAPSPIQPNDLLAAADPKEGALTFKGCAACHSPIPGVNEVDGRRMVGPNLFGIVGAPIARQKDFAYSDALLKHKGAYWTTDELYQWLKNPAAYAPGTFMSFDGLLDPQDRMDLIAYLITLK